MIDVYLLYSKCRIE